MRPSGRRPRRSDCPVNIALEILGDAWSLLIVRDLMFKGRRTFKEFLNAEEKIATNILADRLERLESLGIVSKRRDADDARRHIYRLTGAGIDLAPMLVELILWSAKHFTTGAPHSVIREMTRRRGRYLAKVRSDWKASQRR